MKPGLRIYLLLLLMVFGCAPVWGQGTIVKKVYKDSTVVLTVPAHRGDLQWQVSENGTDWAEIPGANDAQYDFVANTDIYFRVGVKELFCDWHFSEPYLIKPISTPEVITSGVTLIEEDTVRCSGDVVNTGNDQDVARGFCWSLEEDPDLDDSTAFTTEGGGFYTLTVHGLDPLSTYYFRAFATSFAGTIYGNQMSLTTPAFIPRLTTLPPEQVTDASAQLSGTVYENGGEPLLETGICWGTDPIPDVFDNRLETDTPTEDITLTITGLQAVTRYYFRAYAINTQGVGYGDTLSLTTSAGPPDVITGTATEITTTSVQLSGEVTSAEGAPVLERGICWSTTSYPTLAHNTLIIGDDLGSFSDELTGLQVYTRYYYRAYAINEIGVGYGEIKSFITNAEIPQVLTANVTGITTNSASSGGEVVDNGGAPITAQGVCWSVEANPTLADSLTSESTANPIFASNMAGLEPNTTFYVRAYATNPGGTGYGVQKTFTTQIDHPDVVTYAPDAKTYKTAHLLGEVRHNGGTPVTERGFCYATTIDPDINDFQVKVGTGTGNFDVWVGALQSGETYYIRSYAINSLGIQYGNQVFVETEPRKPFVDSTLVLNTTASTAQVRIHIEDTGGDPLFQVGVCIDIHPLPDVGTVGTLGTNAVGNQELLVAGLEANTRYYIRSFAVNNAGVAYGPQRAFITRDDASYRNVPILTGSLTGAFQGWNDIFPDRGGGTMGYSGATFDWERNLLYIVGNDAGYVWVSQAPGYGQWRDDPATSNFIRSIHLSGFSDVEAINYLGNSWIMLAEEGERKIYMYQINDGTTVISKSDPGVIVDPTALFSSAEAQASTNQLEGIAFDFFNRKVFGLCEIGTAGYPRVFMWDWNDATQSILPGSRVEITGRLEGFTQDFNEASDLHFSALYRRLYVVDGEGEQIGEYDCHDPNDTNFGFKLGLIAEPLSQGTTGTDLGDLEGISLSHDGRFIYLAFENEGIAYAPIPLIRNAQDNELTPAHYPFAGTPGTTTIYDRLDTNNEIVFLDYFSDGSNRLEQSLLQDTFSDLTATDGTPIDAIAGIAYDPIDDRLLTIQYKNDQDPVETFVDVFDRDGTGVLRHTIQRGFGLKPDGSFKPSVSTSSATGLFVAPFSDQVCWVSGLDGSVFAVDFLRKYEPMVRDPHIDPAENLYNGLDAGVILTNQHEGFAIDLDYRNAVWVARRTSLSVQEYRSDALTRTIDLSTIPVAATGSVLGDLVDEVTDIVYNSYSDHLFILANNTQSESSYIFEIKMIDRSIIGYIELDESFANAFTIDRHIEKILVLYGDQNPLIELYDRN